MRYVYGPTIGRRCWHDIIICLDMLDGVTSMVVFSLKDCSAHLEMTVRHTQSESQWTYFYVLTPAFLMQVNLTSYSTNSIEVDLCWENDRRQLSQASGLLVVNLEPLSFRSVGTFNCYSS